MNRVLLAVLCVGLAAAGLSTHPAHVAGALLLVALGATQLVRPARHGPLALAAAGVTSSRLPAQAGAALLGRGNPLQIVVLSVVRR